MFYSADLLSLRRRGKLARCWLAATVSETIFKKTCRPTSITKIDVTILCGEILSTVQVTDSDNYSRFSLYLSSQLMYGATKIRFYQTKLLQDDVFSLNIKLIQMNRHENQFNLSMALKEPDDLPVHRMLHDLASPLKLHLITEEPYTSFMEHLIQDEKSFGMLTDFEMDRFLLPEAEEQQKFLNEIRRFDWNESILLPLSYNIFEFDLPNTEEEIRMLSARKDQGELEINEENQFKQPAPGTPKKRSTKSYSETPTKKRKLSSAEVPILESSEVLALKPSEISTLVPPEIPAPAPSEVLPPPFPEKHVLSLTKATAQMAAVEHASEFEIQLPAIENSELIRVVRPKRGRKLFDREINLTNTVMRNWITNVAAHTTQHHLRATNTLPSANEYLTQPVLKMLNRPWAKSLTKSFKRNLIKPSAVSNEFLDFDVDDPKFGETIRPDTTNKSHVQVDELFSKIGITTTEIFDHSKTSKELHSIIECYPRVSEEQQGKEIEEPLVPLLEVTDIEEKFRETTPQLSRRKTKDKLMLSDNPSLNSNVTKREFLAMLEILWHDTSIVKFHDVIPSSDYNKTDAACTFQYCLEYHAEKVIILTQAESFGPILIKKYPSKTGDDNNTHTT
ncbi:uncharacterized protein LOC143349661 [Colletes latitarsis]|uniref:uncharacterized protein LOC143349661 n=1 Tax=Colletes latitarsis TaxID=2605962 RepID=UPI00403581EA